MFIGQAFLYNAVFFTFALVLTKMMKVSDSTAPWYLIPLAIGNFAGPLLLGRFFDTVGRRVMITFTYVGSGLLLFYAAAWADAAGFVIGAVVLILHFSRRRARTAVER